MAIFLSNGSGGENSRRMMRNSEKPQNIPNQNTVLNRGKGKMEEALYVQMGEETRSGQGGKGNKSL
ncbi:hypothetical protein JHK86_007811 [Glycine max]|nr:hypothetical protein JHK86_007811 [Glycine max]